MCVCINLVNIIGIAEVAHVSLQCIRMHVCVCVCARMHFSLYAVT